MLQSHSLRLPVQPGTPAAAPRGHAPAVALASAFALPSLGNVKSRFTISAGNEELASFTGRLERAGVLRPEHWNGDPTAACEKALREYTNAAQPRQLNRYHLAFTGHADLGESDSYMWRTKIKKHVGRRGGTVQVTEAHEPIGAFMVLMTDVMENGPHHQIIGPILEKLEKLLPRLGQTVYGALQRGLDASCRGVTPRNGIHWASRCYWCGEDDETQRVEEELPELQDHYDGLSAEEKSKTHPPTAADVDIFKRQDYLDAYPRWASVGRLQPLPQPALRKLMIGRAKLRVRLRRHRKILDATIALLARLAQRPDTTNDCGYFEETSEDICPFLLCWKINDPLPRIWDDTMNDYSQGDVHMNVNGVFAFHDDATFRRALVRLRNYLQVLHLTEALIVTLNPDKKPK